MLQLTKNNKEKIILVAGGTNPEGLSIVQYFLQQAATVIVPAKSLDEIIKLKAATTHIKSGSLITQLAEMPDYDTAFNIAESIVEKFGRIDIGISVFNSSYCKSPLTELPISDWENMIDTEVTPFFVSARLILHCMKGSKDSLYVSVCDNSIFDQDNFSPLSKIAANAKIEMSKIFAEETKKINVRYYHLWVKINVDNKSSYAINPGNTGSQIMKLYNCKTERPDDVFQLLPEHNLM